MVLVSVVMPSYNHIKYLTKTIESVLRQSFADFELIIIDDFSTDNSQQIIKTYSTKDKRIKPIFHNENLGISRTYNDGIQYASGKYVAFLDSDDLWVERKLEKQLAILEENEELAVWCEGEIIDQNGTPIGKKFTQFENSVNKKKSGDLFEELLCNDNFIFDSSLILKKECLPVTGFNINLKYLNDYQFAVDIAKEHEFYFLDEPLAKYRVHKKNSIFRDSRAWHQDRVVLYKYFLKEYDNKLPSKLKSHLLFRRGWAYGELGENKLARQNIFKAIRTNLFGKKTIPYLLVALTGLRLNM